MPGQRNDETSPEAWELTGRRREELLDWFLTADLSARESLARLRRLTGRDAVGGGGHQMDDGSVWLQEPDPAARRSLIAMYEREGLRVTVTEGLVPPGRERGRHQPRGPVTVEKFIAYYRHVQQLLREAHHAHHAYLELRRRGSHEPALGAQFAIVGEFLDDARLDAVYRQVAYRGRGTVWALEEPPRGDHRQLSLAATLATASFYRFIRARESVVCPACGELEFFTDLRHREICSKSECRRWYRTKWARTKYAVETAKRRRQRGKTRKR